MQKIKLSRPFPSNSYYDHQLLYELSDDIIFVFGSNLAGIHGAGAAREARFNYQAELGKGIGLVGKSYAIPTKDKNIRTLSLDEIKVFIDDFKVFTERSGLYFYVTPIGTGRAGYKHEDIAPMFKGVKNCWLPQVWQYYIER